jgi:hypothetical protein
MIAVLEAIDGRYVVAAAPAMCAVALAVTRLTV